MLGLIRVCLLLLGLCVVTAQPFARAQKDEERLEEWQRRILEAIEESGRGEREASPESYRGPRNDEGAADAAREARRRYGGRVLAVGRVGDGYRVRLLLDDGRVVTVKVPG